MRDCTSADRASLSISMLCWAVVVGSMLSSVSAETPREITLSNGVRMPMVAFGTWHYNDSYVPVSNQLMIAMALPVSLHI
jgi:hypothetical protein